MLFCVNIAPGRFVSDCGRKSGIHQTEGVKANFLKAYTKNVLFQSLIFISS